ncbi:MAG: arsenate reductase (glutaredoxin) [Thermomonas haemolytica]
MREVVIWHRPTCSKSRSALALLREAGIAPRIVDYVAQPPTVAELRQAIARAGLRVREALRKGEPEYAALGLGDPALDDDALLRAMAAHPRLIERPFVFTPKGVRLCRPPERVREIL